MKRVSEVYRTEIDEPFDFSILIFEYEGRAAQAVTNLKYYRNTSLTAWIADQMREAFDHFSLDPDLVVPVPIHWSRQADRGFNQAELICECLPNVDKTGGLLRIRATRTQVGLSIEERLNNLNGAFSANPGVSGKSVLLVDDVMTSGQTARSCAQALREAGASEIGILSFAGNRPTTQTFV